jgi:hypothetical protein
MSSSTPNIPSSTASASSASSTDQVQEERTRLDSDIQEFVLGLLSDSVRRDSASEWLSCLRHPGADLGIDVDGSDVESEEELFEEELPGEELEEGPSSFIPPQETLEPPRSPIVKHFALIPTRREIGYLFSRPIRDPRNGRGIFANALEGCQICFNVYNLLGREELTIVKKIGSGAIACALMLALDQRINCVQRNAELPLSDSFIEWFCNSESVDLRELAKRLVGEGFSPKILCFKINGIQSEKKENGSIAEETIPVGNGHAILGAIKSIIERDKRSVSLSIEHGTEGSCWIVVDRVSDNGVSLRDPLTGKAYEATIAEIVGCIYNENNDCKIIKGFCLENQGKRKKENISGNTIASGSAAKRLRSI